MKLLRKTSSLIFIFFPFSSITNHEMTISYWSFIFNRNTTHCVKSVWVWSLCLVPIFLYLEWKQGVNVQIQTKYGKTRTWKNTANVHTTETDQSWHIPMTCWTSFEGLEYVHFRSWIHWLYVLGSLWMAWIPTYETSVMEEDLNNYKNREIH